MNTEDIHETQNIEDDPQQINNNTLRDELIRLSASKKIKYSEKYIKKASLEALKKIKQEHQRKEMDTVNSQLTENIITRFSELMEQLNMVKDDGKLDEELSENKLLYNDVKTMVQKISPYIPMIGLLSGGFIVVKHMWNSKAVNEVNGHNTDKTDEFKVQNDESVNSGNTCGGVVDSNNDRVDTN